MKHAILILPLAFFLTFANAQENAQRYEDGPYIINDSDGYLNIREKPTVNSKIIDRIEQYELFFGAHYFCDSDNKSEQITTQPNWLPMRKVYSSQVGYVYKENIILMDSLPALSRKKGRREDEIENGNQLVCSNDTLQVVLTLKPFDTLDDERWRGEMWETIETLTITQNGKRKSLPIDNNIKNHFPSYLFSPYMYVFLGPDGELYINIASGDGGEFYSICLSVVEGVIRYTKRTESC